MPGNFRAGFLTDGSEPPVALITNSGASDAFALLGRYAAPVMSVVYGRFGTAYRFHLQGLSSPTPSRMGAIGCREMSPNKFQHTLRNVPEEQRQQLYRGKSCNPAEDTPLSVCWTLYGALKLCGCALHG